MNDFIILDTGPLVAYINQNDKYHGWAKKHFQEIAPPVLTCQAVISEACFLMRYIDCGREIILKMIERDVIKTELILTSKQKH